MKGYVCRLLAGFLCVVLFFSEIGILNVNAESVSQNESVTDTYEEETEVHKEESSSVDNEVDSTEEIVESEQDTEDNSTIDSEEHSEDMSEDEFIECTEVVETYTEETVETSAEELSSEELLPEAEAIENINSDYIASGKHNNVCWSIDKNGHLKISGTGDTGCEFDAYGSKILYGWMDYPNDVITASVDWSGMTNLYGLFWGMYNLENVDLSRLDSSNVTTMSYMFSGCSKISSVDLSSLNTGNVTSMNGMFSSCNSLTRVDLSNLDASNVTTTASMFSYCDNLKNLDFSSFNASKVENMSWMFYGCTKLLSLDLSGIDASKLKDAGAIFGECFSLAVIDTFKRMNIPGGINLPDAYFEVWKNPKGNRVYMINSSTANMRLKKAGKHVINYTVTFNENGGDCDLISRVVKDNNPIGELPEVTMPHYILKGWYTAPTGGTKITAKTKITKDITIYAQWKPAPYKIVYKLNGGKNTEANQKLKSYTVESGLITFEDATKTGYIFDGWYLDKNFNNRVTSIPAGSTGNVTLYAKWKGIEYYIKYHENGAPEGDMDNSVHAYGIKSKLKPVTFYYPGKTFLGWNTKANGKGKTYTNKATIQNLTTKDGETIDLYAQWGTLKYSIEFNANGGKGTTKAMNVKGSVGVVLRKKGFSRTGYTFVGWNTRKDGKGLAFSDMQNVTDLSAYHNKKVVLYAQWKENAYTIKFDGNGSNDGNVESITDCLYTENIKLPACGFTKDGYVFKGWTTKKKGGKLYEEYKKVSKLTTGNKITLYAQWTLENPNKLTVVYKGNGANGSIGNLVISVLSSKKLAKSGYTMAGHTLDSWNTKPDGSGTSYELGSKISGGLFNVNKVIVLYAQWTPKEYKVTFNANNKKASGTMEKVIAKYDTVVNLPECTFTYPGYRFVKWTEKADGSGASYKDGSSINTLKKNVTLYAQWLPEVIFPGVEVAGAGDLSPTELKAYGMGTYGDTVKIGTSEINVSKSGCRLCSLAFMYAMQPGRLEKLEKDYGYSEKNTVLNMYADFYESNKTASKLVLWLAGDGSKNYFSGADMKNTDQNKVGSRNNGDSVEKVLELTYDGIADGKLVMLNIGTSRFHYIVAYKTTDCDVLSADTIMVFDPADGGKYCTLRDAVDRCNRRDAADPIATVRYLAE